MKTEFNLFRAGELLASVVNPFGKYMKTNQTFIKLTDEVGHTIHVCLEFINISVFYTFRQLKDTRVLSITFINEIKTLQLAYSFYIIDILMFSSDTFKHARYSYKLFISNSFFFW